MSVFALVCSYGDVGTVLFALFRPGARVCYFRAVEARVGVQMRRCGHGFCPRSSWPGARVVIACRGGARSCSFLDTSVPQTARLRTDASSVQKYR